MAAPPKNIYSEINQNVAGEPPAKDNNQEENDNILIAENGDILARYRIPLSNNQVNYDLQLPEDSDSSNISEENGIPDAGNQAD